MNDFLVKAAQTAARTSVSEVIESKVKGSATSYSNEILRDGHAGFNEAAWSHSFQETKLVEQGCRFPGIQYYDEGSRTLFILAVMPRRKAADMIVKKAGKAADTLEGRLREAETFLAHGNVPAALRASAETLTNLHDISDQLPTAWFLVNDHPKIPALLEKERIIGGRARAVQETIAALDIRVAQKGSYLSREATKPAEITISVFLTGPGGSSIPAAGVPLTPVASGGLTAKPARGATGEKGVLTVTLDPPRRNAPLSFDLEVAPDREGLIGLGLRPELARGLAKKVQRVSFLPNAVRKVLAGARVTVEGAAMKAERLKSHEHTLEKFIVDRLSDSGIPAAPLSSIEGAVRPSGLSPEWLAAVLGAKGRLLCLASVSIDAVDVGAVSAKAVWNGLSIVDLRKGAVIASGLGQGMEAARYGADAGEAAGLAMDDLLGKVTKSIGRELDEYCRE